MNEDEYQMSTIDRISELYESLPLNYKRICLSTLMASYEYAKEEVNE